MKNEPNDIISIVIAFLLLLILFMSGSCLSQLRDIRYSLESERVIVEQVEQEETKVFEKLEPVREF